MLVKRETNVGSNDLNVVYRPCTMNEFIGNETNKKIITSYLNKNKLPHTLLFSGNAGCGKTTMARIIALGLNCLSSEEATPNPCMTCSSCKSILNKSNTDIIELNVGQSGGKDAVDSIVRDLASNPFNSRVKVIIFDEAHKLTEAAKDLLLKEIEDGYSHVYFIFCTNQPEAFKSKKKGGDAFLSRCTHISFKELTEEDVYKLIQNVLEFEGEDFNKEVLDYIIQETKGVPRDALTALNNIISEGTWTIDSAKNILGDIVCLDEKGVFDLCRTLLSCKWSDSISIFEELSKNMPVETIRIMVSGYFVGCLKKSKKIADGKLFSSILDILSDPIYQTGKPGEYIFYNNMFKIIDTITASKYKK